MQDLIKQEIFELELLDKLNSGKLLNSMVFGGGTMLRLCFGLNRFSVDLDFWVIKDRCDFKDMFRNIKKHLSEYYSLKDSADKFNTLLFEIKSREYPRSLKIEIRKEKKKIKIDRAIAYSKYSNLQVFCNIVSLEDMMKSKIEAFLDRKEIRDVFDIEFLYKKRIKPDLSPETKEKLLKTIEGLSKNDYTVKLGSLLEKNERNYYIKENFKILKTGV